MNVYELTKEITQMSKDELVKFFHSLSAKERSLVSCLPLTIRDKQIPPTEYHRFILALAGRGFGKSYALAWWIRSKVDEGHMSGAIIGPTNNEVINMSVPAILAALPKYYEAFYHSQKKQIIINKTGQIISVISADNPEIRGYNFSYVACDEIIKWCDSIPEKIQMAFSNVDLCLRVGEKPQMFIATTPKPFEILEDIKKRDSVYLIEGSTFENTALDDNTLNAFRSAYEGSIIERQELYGEIIDNDASTLFNLTNINNNRVSAPPKLNTIYIAVDPAFKKTKDSDLTGIVVVGLGENSHGYVLEDASSKYTPDEWSSKVADLYSKYSAITKTYVIVEQNGGGDLIIDNVRKHNRSMPVRPVNATTSKYNRAIPISTLYSQNLIHHVGHHKLLESQMIFFNNNTAKSPDRMDALVHALTPMCKTPKQSKRSASASYSY